MMTLSQYYLVKIAEEAAEVAQIALKAAHFGLSETQPGRDESNAQRIYAELNDLLAVVYELANVANGEFDFQPDDCAMVNKMEKVAGFLRYSQSLGLVEGGTQPIEKGEDGWIPWRGGKCPIENGVWHEIKFGDGSVTRDDNARSWSWHAAKSDASCADIVAYRVIE